MATAKWSILPTQNAPRGRFSNLAFWDSVNRAFLMWGGFPEEARAARGRHMASAAIQLNGDPAIASLSAEEIAPAFLFSENRWGSVPESPEMLQEAASRDAGAGRAFRYVQSFERNGEWCLARFIQVETGAASKFEISCYQP